MVSYPDISILHKNWLMCCNRFSSHAFNFLLVGNPKFTEIPENIVVTVGSTALLTCSASAIPAPTITWHRIKNSNATNEILPGSYGNIFIIDNTIVIENAQYLQDEGYYICRASNSLQMTDAVSFVKVYGKIVCE